MKKTISLILALVLAVTCIVSLSAQVSAANGEIEFDDLIAKGLVISVSSAMDKDAVYPGEEFAVTISATMEAMSVAADGGITYLAFTPGLEADAFEIVSAELVEGIEAEYETGITSDGAAYVQFEEKFVPDGQLLVVTLKALEDVEPGVYLLDSKFEAQNQANNLYVDYTGDLSITVNEQVELINGWVQDGDKWYFYKDSQKVTGWLQDGGAWYYMDANGVMVNKDTVIDGVTHKFNSFGVWLGEVQVPQKAGWVQESGKWYFYKNGAKVTGWLQDGGAWYYMDANGVMVDKNTVINGVTHKFNSSGVWLGEVQVQQKAGWVQESGKWYFYKNGAKVTGWLQDGGVWYYMDSKGVMQTGWLQDGSTWYYLSASGAMVNKDTVINGVTHKFNSSGVWLGEVQVQQKAGWVQESGKWYYYKNGAKVTGWLQDGGLWYYMDSKGVMLTGWVQVSGTWYYLKSSGAMATGWLQDGGVWYYLESSGAMVTGSKTIGGKTYKFSASGACLNP